MCDPSTGPKSSLFGEWQFLVIAKVWPVYWPQQSPLLVMITPWISKGHRRSTRHQFSRPAPALSVMAHVVPKVLLSPSTASSGPPRFESVLELWVAGLRRAGFTKSESKQGIVLFSYSSWKQTSDRLVQNCPYSSWKQTSDRLVQSCPYSSWKQTSNRLVRSCPYSSWKQTSNRLVQSCPYLSWKQTSNRLVQSCFYLSWKQKSSRLVQSCLYSCWKQTSNRLL